MSSKDHPAVFIDGVTMRDIAARLARAVETMTGAPGEVATVSLLKGLETLLLGPQPPRPVALVVDHPGRRVMIENGAIERLALV